MEFRSPGASQEFFFRKKTCHSKYFVTYTYAHQSAYFRIIHFRMAIPNLNPLKLSLPRSVVAARLANAGQSVLLLEAGSDGSLLTEIPAAVGATLGSSLDW